MLIWISFILLGVVAMLLAMGKKDKVAQYFPDSGVQEELTSAINLGTLVPKKGIKQAQESFKFSVQTLGPRANIMVGLFVIVSIAAAWYIAFEMLSSNQVIVFVVTLLVFGFLGYQWLSNRRRAQFQQTFPDALNVLMSAVTAGESLMQAVSFVGQNLDNEVGREFKNMGDRLKLGESPDQVLQRAAKRFPYPEFIFFTIAIRANMSRGGQLRGVLARLIRVLVDSRTMETKKMAMTSEARISAKVVAAIPVIFAVILYNVNPDNINYILHDPKGIWVFYYVVGSELIGLFIVWLLVKAVKL
ncbi:Bacterial type II secretion system protein F domain protein [Vibrio mediterranei]|uniref:Type II secretion system protein F n=1 Tax=Vibrio mediterranei TaxID=689 RepID=A0ABX5D9G0_9VIBR|nr:type II secretion system F family protein [Vibrio mediterranei]MCG9658681.1 type II secretion system F family protein [Vibrio mediterranei]PCD86916.1 type II secretion system protein F [Vibrio mediterranei]PRQ66312.1 type II secretion system protein F [Vibrio mediterranei]PTC04058.1 type II secretion system protein F [Vibrio mediterranei]SBO11804.1 Bacterial type II secretion system protein F domain protein [Vibrio mediterranei]